MQIVSRTGIVTSSHIINESDIRATIFTKEDGVGQYLFKGLKKSKRRHLAGSQVGSILHFSCYHKEKKSILYIHSFEVQYFAFQNISAFSQMASTYLIIETVSKTSAEKEERSLLYSMFEKALHEIGKTQHPYHLVLVFIIHLIRIEGFLPDLTAFHTSLRKHFNQAPLSENQYTFLQEVLHLKFKELSCELLSANEVSDIIFTCVLYIEEYFSIEIKAKRTFFTSVLKTEE